MINHNALEDRLSAVKSGQKIPDPPLPEKSMVSNTKETVQNQNYITYNQFFISEGYKIFNALTTSMLYGFGLKAIFSTSWSFFGMVGVGFLLNHALTILLKLFKK